MKEKQKYSCCHFIKEKQQKCELNLIFFCISFNPENECACDNSETLFGAIVESYAAMSKLSN